MSALFQSARVRTIACLTVIAVGMGGCGKEKRPEHWGALVQGKVTFDGEPLNGGTITFIPLTPEEEGGRPGIARLEADGSYWIGNANPDKPKGLKPGKYKVTFLAMTPLPNGTSNPIAELRIPEELTDSRKTPIECTVTPGDHHLDFELHRDVMKVAWHER